MSSTLTLKGSIEIGGDCASACGPASRLIQQLGFKCGCQSYQAAVFTPVALPISTPGLPGASFVDLDVLEDLAAIEFLYIESDQEMVVRIGAAPAELEGSGAAFGTVANGETLNLVIDGVSVPVVFTVPGDTTAAAIAARINAAAALAGLATPRATVLSSGQLRLDGILTGPEGTIEITSGTATTKLGFTNGDSDVGEGADLGLFGVGLWQFRPGSNAPSRVQISGSGNVKVLAAGRTS